MRPGPASRACGAAAPPASGGAGASTGPWSAHRARVAAERGSRYLQVDASDHSRPILERLGFGVLGVTVPYVWTAADAAGRAGERPAVRGSRTPGASARP